MKKSYSISTLLGVKQQDMAQLLDINRSQWAMFETGKRGLPIEASLLMAEMLNYVNTHKAAAETNALPHEQEIRKKELKKLLTENEYQQLLTDRKIQAVRKKHESLLRLPLLCDFLTIRNQENGTAIPAVQESLRLRISEKHKRDVATDLLNYQMKQKLLVFEKELILEELESLS